MASKQQEPAMARPWLLESVPLLAVVLIAAHVLALVYFLYRLATEKQAPRWKTH